MNPKILLACMIGTFLMTACIKNEAPNAEADIEICIVSGDLLKKSPKIENDRIILLPKVTTDITNLALEFELTPGAKVDPPSGTPEILQNRKPMS